MLSLLEGLAGVIRPQDAICLLGAAASLREKINLPLMQVELDEYERTVTKLKPQVNDADFHSLWDEGITMTVDEAIHFVLEKGGI